jgi:AraC-like DNA-binding protein
MTCSRQFIDDRVVLEAKRLLAHTGVTVTECARRAGFDDPANFSKFFRARTGLTPGAFAARARTPADLTAAHWPAGNHEDGHGGERKPEPLGLG